MGGTVTISDTPNYPALYLSLGELENFCVRILEAPDIGLHPTLRCVTQVNFDCILYHIKWLNLGKVDSCCLKVVQRLVLEDHNNEHYYDFYELRKVDPVFQRQCEVWGETVDSMVAKRIKEGRESFLQFYTDLGQRIAELQLEARVDSSYQIHNPEKVLFSGEDMHGATFRMTLQDLIESEEERLAGIHARQMVSRGMR